MTRTAGTADYARLYAGTRYMVDRWGWRAEGLEDLLVEGWRVLEIGAGRGQLAQRMRTAGWDWTACDPAGAPGVRAVGLPDLPWADRTFDCTVTVDVLEHLPEDAIPAALAELRRLARCGAWAVADMSDQQLVDGELVELHPTQRPATWWIEQINRLGGFAVQHATSSSKRFWLEVRWN